MSILPSFLSTFLNDAIALISGYFPNRMQKGNRLQFEAEKQFKADFAGAKNKVLIACRSFGCREHPDIDIVWFDDTVSRLKTKGVSIVVVSKEDPPEFIRNLVETGEITFVKAGSEMPFVGHLIDDRIIDICYDKDDLIPGGCFWRTERAMPDAAELHEDAILSRTNFRFKQL